MTLSIRRATPADASKAGDICFRAFSAISSQHNFPCDIPRAELAGQIMAMMISHPGFFDVAAEDSGRLLGTNFLDERNPISGIGPITVDPDCQNEGVGRKLMDAVMQRSEERGFLGVRLVQAAYHRRSLALYLRLGFEVREPLVCLQGPAIGKIPAGSTVRQATAADLAECNRLCFKVHGHDRGGELSDAIAQGSARVVIRNQRITGYSTVIGFFGHAVALTNEDLQSLIGAAEAILGAGILVPLRNGDLVRWCLEQRLRVTQTMTLMSRGLYNDPSGAFIPSVTY